MPSRPILYSPGPTVRRSTLLSALLPALAVGGRPLAAQAVPSAGAPAAGTGVVTGTVSTAAGAPVPDATVRVLGTDRQTTADARGAFTLGGVPAGRQTLAAVRPGYAARSTAVAVAAGRSVTVAFTLAPATTRLSEVVVTAEKREEKLERVPAAVTSLSGQALRDARIWDTRDLPAVVPNFAWSEQGVSYQAVASVRGLSSFSDNPAVVTYVDGVGALDIAAGGLALVDVERVEVLRGPQSTLYGVNALGGVVNVVTRRPGNTPEGAFEASAGSLGLQRYNLALRAPVVRGADGGGRVFAGIAGQWQDRHGYYRTDLAGTPLAGSAVDGRRLGDEHSAYVNGYVRWLPGGAADGRFDVTVNAKLQDDRSPDNSAYFAFAPNDSVARADPYRLARNRLGRSSRRLFNASLAARASLATVEFTSVTAAQRVGFGYDDVDYDGTPVDSYYAATEQGGVLGRRLPQTLVSEELRAGSPGGAAGGVRGIALRWTAGLYGYAQQKATNAATVYESAAAPFFSPGVAALLPFASVLGGDQDNRGAAAFGQVTVAPADRLELTGGLRYDVERRRATTSNYTIKGGQLTYSVRDRRRDATFRAVSPKASVAYRLRDGADASVLTYAMYARGFRAGGINVYTADAAYPSFKPEYSDNYEVGAKTSFFDRRLTANADVFQINWRDQQLVYALAPGDYVTGNLGRLRSRGAELELSAVPAPRLRLDYNLGVTDARYRALVFLDTSRAGNRAFYTPAYTSYLAAQYALPLGAFGRPGGLSAPASGGATFVLRGEWQAFGRTYFDVANRITQAPYGLVNLRAGVTDLLGRRADVFGWVRNLGDVRYLNYGSPTFTTFAQLGLPRTAGVTLTTRF